MTTDFDHRVTSGLRELSVTPQAARHLEQAALESDTTLQGGWPAHLIRGTLSADPGGD